MIQNLSVVPDHFKDKDPRNLLYHFPSMPVVKYAKLMQDYCFFRQLKVAEEMAHKLGFILIPFDCMNWQRKKQFGADRKVKIGRNSYFMMKQNELTRTEQKKLNSYIEDIREIG